ncbi:MAG: GGDEF domain-containing protein [Cyanobium sp. CZS 25K]|nr:GGDEF domain-containing protein [Cyanobium sp. CZS25K]
MENTQAYRLTVDRDPQPVNTPDLVFLLLRAATSLLCLLALGVFALEDGISEVLGRPGEPLRWRRWVWVLLDLAIPAQLLAALATLRQRDLLEAELAAAVRHDPLTGLPNRTGFAETATAALAAAAREGLPVAGAMLDIDHFKAINDGWGHGAGDAVLCGVATAMRGVLRPGDVLARVGGEGAAPGCTGAAPHPLRWSGAGGGAGPGRAGERAARRRCRALCRQGRRAEPGGCRLRDVLESDLSRGRDPGGGR